MSLLAFALATSTLPKPANFECELVLVSTMRKLVDGQQPMAWVKAANRGQTVRAPQSPESFLPYYVAQCAVSDAARAGNKNFVVIDGAALTRNHWETRDQRKLAIGFQSHIARGDQLFDANLSAFDVTRINQGGAGFLVNANFAPETRAKGGHPRAGASWPTFAIIGVGEAFFDRNQAFMGPEEMDGMRRLALNVSTLSTTETAEMLDRIEPNWPNITVCAWGAPIPNRQNFIAFPPEGRAVRYKFGHKDGKWFANLVKAY